MNFIESAEDVAAVKSVVVQNVAPDGVAVLNADDPLCVEMAERCPGSVTFFGSSPEQPVIAAHREQGRRVVFVAGQEIVAAHRDREWRFALSAVPLTRGGQLRFQVENVMAAIAAVWALGMDWEIVRAGLSSFVSDAASAPGRFNLFEYRGATVIADYGHNPDAIAALVDAVQALPGKRRSVVISGAGDRRDEDLRRQTEILGDAFDEVIALLRDGLRAAKRTQRIDEIRGEFHAMDLALDRLGPGDLCLILVDQVPEALAHLAQRTTAPASSANSAANSVATISATSAAQ
jgi:cyanophycin synthetase